MNCALKFVDIRDEFHIQFIVGRQGFWSIATVSDSLLKDYITAMDAVKLRSGLQIVMHVFVRGNLYLKSSGLSGALKAGAPKRCAQVVVRAIGLIYVLSDLVYPFMPSISESVPAQLNSPARAVPGVLLSIFSLDIRSGLRSIYSGKSTRR